MTDISYLSPYHRNFYYFTISLPFLSACGLSWIINFMASRFKRVNFKIIAVPILVIAIFFSFISYHKEEAPPRLTYSKTVADNNDYQALLFLAQFPKAKVLVHHDLVVAAVPVTGHEVIGGFFDDRLGLGHAMEFFNKDDCNFRDAMISLYDIDYVVSRQEIFCDYKLLSSEYGINYIYEVNIK